MGAARAVSPVADMFVIIEWNQASQRPSVASDEVYDDREDAENMAELLRLAMAKVGRGERYTVHELLDNEEES